MVQKIIIYDDSPQGPQPGASAAGRLIAFVVMIAIAFSVYCVVAKQNPLSGLGTKSAAGAPQAGGAGSTKYSEAILREARKFDNRPYIYGGGHPDPAKWYRAYKNGGSGLDCSGLINVAVYAATDGKLNDEEVAQTYQNNKHWTKIPMKDAQAGDIMYRKKRPGDSDHHVVIVVENRGDGELKTFEAFSSKVAFKDQIGEKVNQSYGRFTSAYRFTFKG